MIRSMGPVFWGYGDYSTPDLGGQVRNCVYYVYNVYKVYQPQFRDNSLPTAPAGVPLRLRLCGTALDAFHLDAAVLQQSHDRADRGDHGCQDGADDAGC